MRSRSSQRARRRVVFVESNIDGTVGGSYISLLQLTSGLDRERFEPVVVFATENDLIPQFRARGIAVKIRRPAAPFRLRGKLTRPIGKVLNFLLGWAIEPLRIARFLRREGTNLLHLNNSITRNDSWMLGARIARVPCVTHERGINPEFLPRVRWLARPLLAVICISEAVRLNMVAHGLGNLPLCTIHNGIDLATMEVTRSAGEIRAELGLRHGARLVGLVGNIRAWKGQDIMVRAMARLHAAHPDVVCLLVGDTAPADREFHRDLTKLIEDNGLRESVRLIGYRKDVANYVNAFEIQIHASIQPEPFGRVLLEAMAIGKPLVASRGGAVPEIVLDGTTGLMFEPGNPDALADCVATLLSDPERAAAMGEQGRRRVQEQFSVEATTRAVEALYESLAF